MKNRELEREAKLREQERLEREAKLREQERIREQERLEREAKLREQEIKDKLILDKQKRIMTIGKSWADMDDDDDYDDVQDDTEEDILDKFVKIQSGLKSPVLTKQKSPSPAQQSTLEENIPEVSRRVGARDQRSILTGRKTLGKCFGLFK